MGSLSSIASVRARLLLAVMVAAGLATAGSAPMPTAGAAPTVRACGTNFCLAGSTFRFTGTTSYNLLFRPGCEPSIDAEADLRTAHEAGMSVVRFSLFQELVPGGDYTAMDRLLAAARRQHVRLFPMLETANATSASCYLPRGPLGIDWYRSGYREPYAGHPLSYLDYVSRTVSRYRDDPAIFAWELVGEPVARGAPCDPAFFRFFAAMSARVKQLDPGHLVTTGGSDATALGFACPSGPDRLADILSLPTVDFAVYHDYTVPPCAGTVPCLPDAMAATIRIAHRAGKPVVAGEIGIDRHDPHRAAKFLAKAEAAFAAGVAGVMPWQLQQHLGPGVDRYAILPDDAVLRALRRLGCAC